MSESTIFKEIKQDFIEQIKEEKILEDDVFQKFKEVFGAECDTPNIEQLKQILFNEELS